MNNFSNIEGSRIRVICFKPQNPKPYIFYHIQIASILPQAYERGFWNKAAKDRKEEAKKKKEEAEKQKKKEEKERAGLIAAAAPPANIIVVKPPPHEPTWDTVRRTAGPDDFSLVTWLAHLYDQGVNTAKKTGTALYKCLMGSIQSAQMHWHYETCKKNGHLGNDESCRLEQPRLIVNESR